MSEHNHAEHVAGCFRCDLSREEAREYAESTADTYEVREMFTDEVMNPEIEGKRFDRWLASEVHKAKAEAWDEAIGEASEQGTIQVPDNPYRADQIERTTDDH